ncbi:MAG: transporter [Planctomycetota bacterium]|nr:MAG: transporter [Planctomycetota bacterium]
MGRKQKNAADFMLGGRTLPTWAILLSIVATETSTVTFLSIPGWAYKNGIAWQQIPLGYVLGRLLVILVLMPRYFAGEMFTAYEVLHRRFGGGVQKLASVLFIVTRTLADGLRLFLTALVLQIVVGIPLVESVVAIGIATVLYTFLGGMRAVVWTDAVQFLLYVAGALLALFVILGQIDGGWDTVMQVGSESGRLTWFHTGWDLSKVDTLWAGLIGGAILSFSTHGVDQMMVQRYLSARSRASASTALALSGIVVWAQFVLFLVLGVALFVFYGQQNPTPNFDKGDRILSTFVVDHMPKGTVGLLLGAVFAAAMSTLSSSLNSSATTLVRDLIRGAKPVVTGELLLVRVFTVLFGVAQIFVAIYAREVPGSTVNNVLAIAGFTTGLILGVFLLGQFVRRASSLAALIGLVLGLAVMCVVHLGPKDVQPFASLWPFAIKLAWPYYALIASSSVLIFGLLASLIFPSHAATHEQR